MMLRSRISLRLWGRRSVRPVIYRVYQCIDSKITDHIWPSSPPPRSAPLRPPTLVGAGAVPGLISGDEPRLVLLRDLPLEWTVGISPRGAGTGEGEPPLPGQNVTQQFLSGNPLPGARAVMAISRGKPCPGSGADAGFSGERESGPESGSSPGSPRSLPRVFSVQTQFLQIAIRL